MDDENTLTGFVVIELFGPDGELKERVETSNIITDTGDLYVAGKIIAAIAPASAAAPTAATGMQIGSGSTAVAKSGAGGAIVTLLAGQAFDATFPSTANLGAGLGVNAVYKTTYAAGTGTGTVTEATLTNGAIGTASTAGNTIARIIFTGVVKGAADSLSVSWNHKALGA